MRIALLLLAAEILCIPQANAARNAVPSRAPQAAVGNMLPGTTSSAPNDPRRDARISVSNADDSMAHWSTCVQPACHPGGKGLPVSTNQTINNSQPSTDGASMLLTETANSRRFYTDVLWTYKMRGCDACTQMNTDFRVYPVSSSHVASLEYDAFLFDATNQLNIMWGMQWSQRRGVWQVWDQGASRWIDTSVTSGPTYGDWNHIQFAGHRVIGDSSCNGTECLYYDSLTLNGETYKLGMTEPAGPIHPGWHSVSGFQFQLDATPVASGSATVSEYVDQANMWAN